MTPEGHQGLPFENGFETVFPGRITRQGLSEIRVGLPVSDYTISQGRIFQRWVSGKYDSQAGHPTERKREGRRFLRDSFELEPTRKT